MRHILLSLMLAASYVSHGQDEFSDYEKGLSKKFASLSDEALWENKESFMSKAHSRSISGTIFLSAGIPALAYGVVDGVINKNESSYSAAGAGIVLTVVGSLLTNSSKNNKTKELLIEKELFRRSRMQLSSSGIGFKLMF